MMQKRLSMVKGCFRALFVGAGVALFVSGTLAVLLGASETGLFPRHFQLVHPWTRDCTQLEEAALLICFGTAASWVGLTLLWLDSLNIRLSGFGQTAKRNYVDLSKVRLQSSEAWTLKRDGNGSHG